VRHFLISRRSIRIYRDKPVDQETLQKIIKIAGYAPSGHNSQPVHWLVIQGKEKVQQFAALVVDWMRYMIKEMPDRAKAMQLGEPPPGQARRLLREGFSCHKNVACKSAGLTLSS